MKNGDIIKLKKEVSEIPQPFIINAQPLLLQNISFVGINGQATIKGESFIFDDMINSSDADTRHITVNFMNLRLTATGIVRVRKRSASLNVIIKNCVVSDLRQNHRTSIIYTYTDKTTIMIKNSIISNFMEGMRIKSSYVDFKIKSSSILNSWRHHSTISPKFIVVNQTKSLVMYLVKSKFYHLLLLDLESIQYGTSNINISNSVFNGVLLNAGMPLINASLVVANSSFSPSFSNTLNRRGLIKVFSSSAHFQNCNFSNIIFSSSSIISFHSNSTVSFVGCHVKNNLLVGKYGAIYLSAARASFTNCTFENNIVIGQYDGAGGAISAVSGSILHIKQCVFKRNRAKLYGGAVFLRETRHCSLESCIFENNVVSAHHRGFGGAILAFEALNTAVYRGDRKTIQQFGLNVTRCLFKRNSAFSGGAISSLNFGMICIRQTTFENHTADIGGAVSLYKRSTKLCLWFSFFQNNKATRYGGAIFSDFGNQLTVEYTTFESNSVNIEGGAVFIMDSLSSFVRSIFESNSAYGQDAIGGAISVHKTPNTVMQSVLNISFCLFKQNKATLIAGAILSIGLQMVSLTNTTFQNNSVIQQGGALYIKASLHLDIYLCTYIGNRARDGGAILLFGGRTSSIRNTTFENNTAVTGYGGALVANKQLHLYLDLCTYIANKAYSGGGAICLMDVNTSSIRNTAFGTNAAVNGNGGALTLFNNSHLSLYLCIFTGNKAFFSGGAIISAKGNTLSMINSTFENNIAITVVGGALIVERSSYLYFYLCTYERNKARHNGGAVTLVNVTTSAFIKTTFRNNTATVAVGGALGIWKKTSVYFYRCIFHGNKAEHGGALFFYSRVGMRSLVRIHNSLFSGNMAKSAGGAICNIGTMFVKNSSFQTSSYSRDKQYFGGEVIYSEGKLALDKVLIHNMDKINTENSLLIHTGPSFQINNIKVNCSKGKDIVAEKPKNTQNNIKTDELAFVAMKCVSCTPHSYSVNAGTMGPTIDNQTRIHCYNCPFGGNCANGQIKAAANFWGYSSKTNIEEFRFATCPFGYCCMGDQCRKYNSCGKGRHGILCGQCQRHLTENVVTPDCLEFENCLHPWFWGIVGVAGIFYVLFFIYQKEIASLCVIMLLPKHGLHSIKSVVFSCVKKTYEKIFKRESYTELLTEDMNCTLVENETLQFELDPLTNNINMESVEGEPLQFRYQGALEFPEEKADSNLFSGFLKIIIFFYQTSVLYKVYNEGKSHDSIHLLQEIISTLCNLRTDGHFSQGLSWCPFDGLTPVPKLLLKTAFTFYLFVAIFVLILVSKIFKHFRNDEYVRAHNSRLYCCMLRVLLVAYSSITVTCFTLLFCVNLGPFGNVLHIDGSIQCYQWWQFLDIVVIFIWIASYPIGIYAASWLMHRRKLSTEWFLLSLFLPFPTIMYWVYVRIYGSEENITRSHTMTDTIPENILDESSNKILEVLEGPFRKYNGTDSSYNYNLPWESILIAQRLVLIFVRTFVSDILIRLYLMLFLTIVFLIHHKDVYPFSSRLLNHIQTTSYLMLVTICSINILPAYIYMNPMSVSSYIQGINGIFRKVETVLMLVAPFVVGSCIVGLLSIRILQFLCWIIKICVKMIRLCCKRKGHK